jgi:uncharacterized protein RhaS with RHS repeats
MQARYYDPVIGRFYSNDPVGALGHFSRGDGVHGFNRYAYVGNNPLSAKATADLSIGTGEESFKSELEVSTDKGFEGTPLKMEQALTFDDKGLSLKPNFDVSVGVGG